MINAFVFVVIRFATGFSDSVDHHAGKIDRHNHVPVAVEAPAGDVLDDRRPTETPAATDGSHGRPALGVFVSHRPGTEAAHGDPGEVHALWVGGPFLHRRIQNGNGA